MNNTETNRTGMSCLSCETEIFKNTQKDTYYNMPFSKDEDYYVSKGEISESIIKDWHYYLKRNLTIKELLVLELCSKNGILLSENDFKMY